MLRLLSGTLWLTVSWTAALTAQNHPPPLAGVDSLTVRVRYLSPDAGDVAPRDSLEAYILSVLRSSRVHVVAPDPARHVPELRVELDVHRGSHQYVYGITVVLCRPSADETCSFPVWQLDHRDSVHVEGAQFIGTDTMDLLEGFIVAYQAARKPD